MDKYVKKPVDDIMERVTKKTLHSDDTVASSEKVVKNILSD